MVQAETEDKANSALDVLQVGLNLLQLRIPVVVVTATNKSPFTQLYTHKLWAE